MAGIFSLITNMAYFFKKMIFFLLKSLHLYFGSLGCYVPVTLKKKGDKIYITAIQEEIKTFYTFYFFFFFLGDRVVAEVGASTESVSEGRIFQRVQLICSAPF